MDRRTLTMNWDNIGDDDDDAFFESFDRGSSAVPGDLGSSGSDEDEYDDSRMSFVSAVSTATVNDLRGFPPSNPSSMLEDYDMWMAEPGSIKDRRKRLLQGMGLSSSKGLLAIASAKFNRVVSKKVEIHPTKHNKSPSEESKPEPSASVLVSASASPSHSPLPSTTIVLVRSRSDGDIVSLSAHTKKRKEELIGDISKQRLTRTSSAILTPNVGVCQIANSVRLSPNIIARSRSSLDSSTLPDGQIAQFFLIKNLDTGNEFIVKEYNDQGMWNKLSDLQTGKQLTMEEFEKSVGYSPVVKELMRRENVTRSAEEIRKATASILSKSFRHSKKKTAALLKNIKGSMSGLKTDKEREQGLPPEPRASGKNSSSQWVKVRNHGKAYKEFTGLHLCQEIQAHEGSIWTIRFSWDARFLASAGEDRVIHVWEVQECEVMSGKQGDDLSSCNSTPLHPMACGSPERPPLAEITPMPSERRKKGKNSSKKKGNSIPDYVNVPETVFALSERPICSFIGHQEDVLDLSWSRSQQLLSSSMDKTVRLWDMETKNCLKLFAHNDYVTCIQFNPVDDDYFISGSLDAKVRIWNIPDRQVVDWTDLHEMVTAACYTPDGQGALVGSHKGTCRLYSTADSKIEQKELIDIRPKKKSQPKKVTGFQFDPWNPSEVLITSADSRIRIFDGTELIHKFRGFRNTSSQISSSFTPDGKYVISASEDSQVYIWKREESRHVGNGKSRSFITTQSHEHFPCRDVSVAIPWPGCAKNEPPVVEIHSKRHSKRCAVPQSQSSSIGSPTQEDTNSKRQLPPLPRKQCPLERVTSCQEEDPAQISRTNSGIGESFSSSSGSMRYDPSSIANSGSSSGSQSWSSSWSWFDNSHGHTIQATAWGLVIVTAGLGGEIRAYQNFGLPLKVGRQTNLFRDLT